MKIPGIMHSIAARPLAGLLWMLAGCGGDASGGGPEWLTAGAAPVELETVLETENSTTKSIGPAGGTVSVTAADGTRYRLRIPEGALLSNARITMTPARSVAGLPLDGGSVAAVQLEPSGLHLMKPATLSIRTEQEIPVEEQIAYAWYGQGQDAHLYPLGLDTRRIEMELLHFSGYGFGRALPNDPGRQALQRATAREARLQARVAEVINRERQRLLAGGGEGETAEEFGELISELSLQYYDEVIRPLMKIAEADWRMAACAIARFLGWERQNQLLGLGSGDSDTEDASAGAPESHFGRELERRRDEGWESFQRILENGYEEGIADALRQCREEHDFAALTRILVLERQRQLMGGDADEGILKEALEEFDDCMNFEIEFGSIFDNRVGEAKLYYHVQAKVPVELGLSSDPPYGSAPLEYVEFIASGNPKRALFGDYRNLGEGKEMETLFLGILEAGSGTMADVGTRPGTFTVYRIEWDWNTYLAPGTDCAGEDSEFEHTRAEDWTVTFKPGTPTEITRFTPTHIGEPFNSEDNDWISHWSRAHAKEVVNIPDLEPSPDDAYPQVYRVALKPAEAPGIWRIDYDRPDPGDVPGMMLSEDSYLVLRHTPR